MVNPNPIVLRFKSDETAWLWTEDQQRIDLDTLPVSPELRRQIEGLGEAFKRLQDWSISPQPLPQRLRLQDEFEGKASRVVSQLHRELGEGYRLIDLTRPLANLSDVALMGRILSSWVIDKECRPPVGNDFREIASFGVVLEVFRRILASNPDPEQITPSVLNYLRSEGLLNDSHWSPTTTV